MIKRILLASLTFLLLTSGLKASHLMGGEITWKCLPNGQYRFFMKVYRDCGGVNFGTTGIQLDVHNYPGLSNINMILLLDSDISPKCNSYSGTPIICNSSAASGSGAVEEFTFQSNPITLTGVPPAAGWIFSYSNCCRNGAIDNIQNPSSYGFTLRAIMHSYNGLNTNPCYDSSPYFVESPNTIICSGYPFTYNPTAVDPELDSLVYSWAQPLESWSGGAWNASNPAPIPWSPNYSTTSPLPGPFFNPLNVAATLDPTTGEINYTCYTSGIYVSVNKVSAYKCGQLVAEIFRDVQIALLPCPNMNNATPGNPAQPNNPPTVTIYDNIKGKYYTNPIVDTIYAGQIMDFLVSGYDTDFDASLAVTEPASGGYQRLRLYAASGEFGTGFTSTTTGCQIAPCATLNPPSSPGPVSQFLTTATLHWQTSCEHLGYSNGCINFQNVYTFIIKVKDDFCPAPGITVNTIKIVLMAPPKLNAPVIRCTSVAANGDVTLNWTAPVDTFNSFNAYQIYHSTNPNGPYSIIDSVFSISQTSFTHVGAGANLAPHYYYIVTRDLCKANRYSSPSDTAASMYLTATNVGGGQAQLNWNPVTNPLLSSSIGKYKIYMEYPLGTWSLIDSTNVNAYLDNVNILGCNDSINYRVEKYDSSGCTSVSSVNGALFQNYTQPDPPDVRCLVALNNGSVSLSWIAPVDTGLSFDGYFIYSATNPGGPFLVIDSIFNYNQTTYTHATANIMSNARYYYLKTYCICGNAFSINSDTLQAIRLTVLNVGGIAQLSWNPLHVPLLPSSAAKYYVYQEYPAGVWTLIDSTASTSINIPKVVCNDSINFRIEISDASGCVSKSTIDGKYFVDNSIPDPPELRCISVNANGSINLNWSLPVDTGMDYNSYHLYYATNAAGPFNEIDSLFNYNTSAYTHNAANAYLGDVYYTIKTRTGCGVRYSVGSDTLRAIRLDVTNPLGGQIANLNWNAIHTPNLPTSSGSYNIYKKYTSGAWSLLATTPALSYLDTNAVCIDSINYRIEIADALVCTSVSTIDGATFIDNTIPDAPVLRCVSVNPSGNITLNWTLPADTGKDFNSYHIFYATNPAGPFTEIDSLFVYGLSSYTHASANAYLSDLYYTIKTRTGCGVRYSVGSDTLRAIRLDVTNPLGGQIANLNWNAIHTPNLATSSGIYSIYKKYSTGGWSLLATTPALSYIDTNAVCIDSINYRVEIGDALGCTSVSTIDGATFIDNTIPDAPELRCVSVNPNGSINLNWALPVDTGLDYNSYHIFYSTNIAGPFTAIDSTFNYNQSSYAHTLANAYAGDVYYTLETRTGCGVQYSVPSDTLRAIRLDVTNPLGGQVANLKWNAMRIPALPSSSGVYNVFKEYPAGVWNLIGNTAALSYTDSTLVCIDSINYRVEIADALICNSVSTIDGATFIDNTVPAAPELRCLDVNANGTVSLTWTLPVDTGLNFNSYHIYRANNQAGPYIAIDSLFNYYTPGYTDATSNAYAGDLFYNIKSRTGCGVEYSLPSDTLQAIVINVTNPGGLNTATINWNHLHNPELLSSTGYFYIYQEYPAGVWTLIDSTSNTSYLKPLVLCYDSVHYRVAISNSLGCVSRSTIDGDLFVDKTIPAAPDLRCVAIDPTGKATITWIAPVDTGLSFSSYHVFYGTSANGPFTAVDSIFNYNTTSYTHVAANGNNTNIYYYIESRTNCGVQYSLPSDTLHGIKLNVTNTGNGIANLQWNALHSPLLLSSDLNYKVYREYPAGTWAYLNQTPLLFYQDTINLCNAFINYRIEIGDSIGCTSVSSIDGDLFKDVTPPAVTLLDTVSVNPANGEVTVSWLPNTSNDVIGYIVYLFNGASWDSIGSTNNINALSYLYAASNADNVIERYNIAAYDSCGNLAPLGNEHNSIHLSDTLDKCNASINLKWNSYKNMPGGLASYNIFMSENGSPFKLLANVSAANLTYIHQNVKKDSLYCYFIQAVGMTAARTASSNKVCMLADVLIMPEFTYIKRVTVQNHNEVLIECFVDTAADVSRYKLMRSGDDGISYGLLQQQAFAGLPEISFTDLTPSTDSVSYHYKLIDVSTCDRDVQESNIGRTILLQTTPFENLINKLEWNAYEDWNGGVQKYDIYRYYNGVWTAAPIATVPANSRTYFDNVANFTDGTGEFCYLIEATEGNGNIYGYQMKSESNENCAIQEPHLFLPNAFTPGGINPMFHPYMLYYLREGYAMQVFNRWGQTVFSTGNPDLGWDGSFDGQPAPDGVYVYHVIVKGANGKTLEKRGTVTLLR